MKKILEETSANSLCSNRKKLSVVKHIEAYSFFFDFPNIREDYIKCSSTSFFLTKKILDVLSIASYIALLNSDWHS